MAWLAGYSKRKPITITGGASGAQTDFQLKLATTYAAAMQADFDDVRYTQADGTTLIDAWLEIKVDSTSATISVEFPTTPANTVEQTYYMYYGNAGAASDWDGTATFLSFFGGNSAGWTEVDPSGHISITGDRLEFTNLSRGEDAYVYQANANVNGDVKIENTFKITSFVSTGLVVTSVLGDMVDDYNNLNNGITGGVVYSNPDVYVSKRVGDVTSNAAVRPAISTGTRYWTTTIVDRSGNTETKIYSDSSRTTQVGATSVLDVSNVAATLDNVFIINSYNSGNADRQVTGWVDDLTISKYVTGPPTYAFGAEESDPGAAAAPTSIFYGPFVGPLGGPI